jgi:hypothetical protein
MQTSSPNTSTEKWASCSTAPYFNKTFTNRLNDSYKNLSSDFAGSRSVFRSEVLSRIISLLLIPGSAIANLADTVVAVFAQAGVILTGGNNQRLVNTANLHFSYSSSLSVPFYYLIRVINPRSGPEPVTSRGITLALKLKLEKIASKFFHSDNLLKKHTATRLTYALLAVACVVTRAVEAVFGLVGATLAVLTLGKFHRLNQFAYVNLHFTHIVRDIIQCATKIVFPSLCPPPPRILESV